MKIFPPNIIHHRNQFEHLSYRLRTGLLILAGFVVLISLVLALVVFSYIFNVATHPEQAQELVDQWAAVFNGSDNPNPVLPVLASPARWFAVFTLGVLAFIVTRIPLLLLQMGIQLFIACNDERRIVQEMLREVMSEMRRDNRRPVGDRRMD